MNPFMLILYFGLAAIFNVNSAFGFLTSDDKKCKYMRTEKKLKVRCFDMNLKEVPQYLTSSVEILDLSFNRIKKLQKSSLSRYSNVESLLLYENMIYSIEPETFSLLTSLQEIDLSNNVLATIPMEMFELPSLRNLYLDSNPLTDIQQHLKNLKTPIRAPLEYLNIADCNLDDLPNLGILPNLWHLNASKNPLEQITVTKLATMCHLKSIDLIDTKMPYCACHTITQYLIYLGVKTNYILDCDRNDDENINSSVCPNLTNTTIISKEFQECNSVTAAFFKINSKNIYWLIGAGIVGVLTLLTCLYCCVKSIRKKHKKRKLNNSRNNNVTRHRNRTDDELLRRTKDDCGYE